MRREKGSSPAEHGRSERKRPVWPLLAGLALVALLAVSCGSSTGKQSAKDPGPQASADKSRVAPEEPQAGADLEHPSLGDEDAPVLMIEYADFQ